MEISFKEMITVMVTKNNLGYIMFRFSYSGIEIWTNILFIKVSLDSLRKHRETFYHLQTCLRVWWKQYIIPF